MSSVLTPQDHRRQTQLRTQNLRRYFAQDWAERIGLCKEKEKQFQSMLRHNLVRFRHGSSTEAPYFVYHVSRTEESEARDSIRPSWLPPDEDEEDDADGDDDEPLDEADVEQEEEDDTMEPESGRFTDSTAFERTDTGTVDQSCAAFEGDESERSTRTPPLKRLKSDANTSSSVEAISVRMNVSGGVSPTGGGSSIVSSMASAVAVDLASNTSSECAAGMTLALTAGIILEEQASTSVAAQSLLAAAASCTASQKSADQ